MKGLAEFALASLMAALTGLGARVAVPIGPTPFTLQSLFVLLSGLWLRPPVAALAMVLYLALGASGVPWFSQGRAGLEIVRGAGGGYLLGFVVAAWMASRYARPRLAKTANQPRLQAYRALLPPLGAATAALLALGAVWSSFATGQTLSATFSTETGPLIPGALLKLALAVAIGVEVQRAGRELA